MPQRCANRGSSRSTVSPRWSRAAVVSRSPPSSSSVTATAMSVSAMARRRKSPSPSRRGPRRPSSNLFAVALAGSTITHQTIGVMGAGRVLLKPAAPGTGVIAGGAARSILEEAGIHDVLAKSLGSSNAINVARATIEGLKSLQRPDEVAARRGLPPTRSCRRACCAPTTTANGRRCLRRTLIMAENTITVTQLKSHDLGEAEDQGHDARARSAQDR